MKLLDYFRRRKNLVRELHRTQNKLTYLYKLCNSQVDRISYFIEKRKSDYLVKQKNYLYCGGTMCHTIKRFDNGDDPKYAELCAKELLDKLNEEV